MVDYFKPKMILEPKSCSCLGLSDWLRPLFLSPYLRQEGISVVFDVHKTETTQVKCSKCPKTFLNEKRLKQHIGKKHNTKKRHAECSDWPKKFRSKYALRFHIKQVHQQATKVVCPLCQLECYNKYALKRHTLKSHN